MSDRVQYFNRIEKKYLLDEFQYLQLFDFLKDKIITDVYGESTIYNLYYDTSFDLLIKKSLERPIFKEKLRIRSYCLPKKKDLVFIEIKRKYQGVVYKRRFSIELDEAYNLLDINSRNYFKKNQISKEVRYMVNFYELYPKLILIYDRIAYKFLNEDIRLTIDKNIKNRREYLKLEEGDSGKLLLKNKYLMEVKTQNSVSLWFSKLLSELKIFPIPFSKYGEVYMSELKQGNSYDKILF
ncbi:polyphosphate polymerase domain-containing protein [Parvimonas parva]|uniref:Polyphosphate polymerase domain-containing protein n=1 Tax=Parvimonas parva TaxID=2769485 RepID=A0ABS1C8I6_9FIRM|nr:polyphosphate polymerase domain-containing protein [Parvimonas parva]MBK1468385.1 polyphosphate polymerase domain-containing protein [Parvimonas parva]